MRYREVIHPPLWLVAFVYFLFLSLVLSIWAALGNNPALITFILSTLITFYLYFSTALVIEIDDSELRVGKAHIDHKYIGAANNLRADETRLLRTRDADPAAYLAIRFWAPKAVQIIIDDPRDTTPYWLISSRNGEALIKALKS